LKGRYILKASERKITKLFSESDTVFSIPVYQRDYNWQEKQCQRLFKDILQTGKNEKVSSYFLGSIVYIHDGIYGVGEKEFHVIDGQQRMTTLTLLFLAIYFKLKGTILAKDADKIYNQYVVNPYSEKEIKLKLLPPEENLYILNKISHNKFNELEAFQDRNMLKNYLFFEKELENLSFDDMKHLSNGIEKLIYIDIALEKGKDDPQKIFESLNSTGLDLSQGDLIRNYILMDLERGEQNRIYKEIWIPIENNCKVSDGSEITSYVSDFIRDYLTLKTEKISSKPKVFETFKAYYEKENDEKLEDMKKYSEAYSYIIKPGLEKDRDIQRELDYLKSLDKTVINTFLIGILKDYKDNILEKDELVNMLILLQSYLWRRYITEKPTNALNKIFIHVPFYLYLVVAGFIIPIMEEIIFRGLLAKVLFGKYFKTGLVISSFLFMAGHSAFTLQTIIIYGIMSAGLAITYYKTNHIEYSMGVHILNNSIVVLLSLFV